MEHDCAPSLDTSQDAAVATPMYAPTSNMADAAAESPNWSFANWDTAWQGCWEPAAWNAGWHAGDWSSTWWLDGHAHAQASPHASSAVNTAGSHGQHAGGHADEQTARVHFQKTYSVLAEIQEAHPDAFKVVNSFVDLGCAPGGFSSRLLEQFPDADGVGITLPVLKGGFPMMFTHPRLRVDCRDLMATCPEDLGPSFQAIDVCMADAQDLGRRTNRESKGGSKGGKRTHQGKNGRQVHDTGADGIGAVCNVLGIWALTLQQLFVGLSVLRSGGTCIFRFGWRGRGGNEEFWYREATFGLLACMMEHFGTVAHMKSEFSHQADASFYVVASGFKRDAFETAKLHSSFREAVERTLKCERAEHLPWCMEELVVFASPALRKQANKMLETVGKLRAIGLATRRHMEDSGREKPEDAILWISPVPFSLTMQRLRESLERYGKIVNLKRRAHPVGVGADAFVQFSQPAHAALALEAITVLQILGPNISVRRLTDAKNA